MNLLLITQVIFLVSYLIVNCDIIFDNILNVYFKIRSDYINLYENQFFEQKDVTRGSYTRYIKIVSGKKIDGQYEVTSAKELVDIRDPNYRRQFGENHFMYSAEILYKYNLMPENQFNKDLKDLLD